MPHIVSPSSLAAQVSLSPDPDGWSALLDERWAERPIAGGDDAFSPVRFRAQLGLPTDRPIVMSGHQAAVWHPGILAKYIAASALCTALAERSQASPAPAAAWLVVDQDVNEWGRVRFPIIDSTDGARRVRPASWEWAADSASSSESPTGRTPPVRHVAPPPAKIDPAAASVAPGLTRLHRALSNAAGDSSHTSVAAQLAAAVAELARPVIPGPPLTTIMATSLAKTDLMRELVDRMIADPAFAVGTYNAAVAAHPGGGVAPLAIDRDAEEYELPFWRVVPSSGPGGETGRAAPAHHERLSVRERVTSSTLADIPIDELAPRALLMTAMLRLAGCDLFIHGTGGGATVSRGTGVPPVLAPDSSTAQDDLSGYDRITEAWVAAWLGRTLAPSVVATATLTLDMDAAGPAATEEDVHSAVWRAHHARHDPALLGDADAAARKRELLGEIASAKRAGDRRAAADSFARMQTLLRSARQSGREIIVDLDRRAEQAREAARDADVVFDRTWPFPLYSDAQLEELRSAIVRALDRV